MEQTATVLNKYGRLSVIADGGKNKWGYRMVDCKCDCGNPVHVSLYDLKRGHTSSCGCFRSEKIKAKMSTHGLSRTPTHNSWRGMIARCNDPKHDYYRLYGGRGISVCERWLQFDNFYFDMGEKPEGASLDRINNNGNYEPSNCRWATKKEQARNCSTNRLLQYKGRTQSLAAWADEIGMSLQVLRMRIFRGWPTDIAIEKPVKQ